MPRGEKPKGEDGNVIKFQSYALNWGRIKKSIGSKLYGEAINIEESIIRDRLLSYFCKAKILDGSDPKIKHKPLKNLIDLWKKHIPNPISDTFFDDLQESTDAWRRRRNKVHESVLSLPGEEHGNPKEYEENLRQTAVDGERLVKSIQNWYRREKYAMKMQEKLEIRKT